MATPDDTFLKQRAAGLWKEARRMHMQGDVDRAISLYTKSIGIYPTAEAYTFLGWAYSYMNRLDEAIVECKHAIEVDPSFGNPYNDIGSYLSTQGRQDEAIEWLEKAKQASRYEARHFPYMNLGRIYAARGMVLRALAEYEGALALSPDEPHCLSAIEELKKSLN